MARNAGTGPQPGAVAADKRRRSRCHNLPISTRKTGMYRIPTLLLLLTVLVGPAPALAASATEIDIKVDAALARFRSEVTGGDAFLAKARGVLVFPEVVKAGFGIGGEYGEGALRVGGKTAAYYNTAAASIGFQLGAQLKTVVLVFLTAEALQKFRDSDGWEAGVDGSVALVELGAGKDLNSLNVEEPIVGFVIGNKGLMYNLTLEGSKMTRIER
jgi:lipid-binding SYLF domain-containing protein